MTRSTNPVTAFRSKLWYRYICVFIFTFLASFCLILGPLFLLGVVRPADGKPGTDAGIAMSIIGVAMGLIAFLMWFNVVVRRKPLLRLGREGIEINLIGSSSLDGVPLVPPLIRVAWLIISFQGFRKQTGWIPWSMLRSVEVTGLPMSRKLTIDGTVIFPTFLNGVTETKVGSSVMFRDSEFLASLDEIASTIWNYHSAPAEREMLPNLNDGPDHAVRPGTAGRTRDDDP